MCHGGVVKIVPYMFALKNQSHINNNDKYIMFRDITLYELKWKYLGVKQPFRSVGVPSQIKDVV